MDFAEKAFAMEDKLSKDSDLGKYKTLRRKKNHMVWPQGGGPE